MWPQSGDGVAGLNTAVYGVPDPVHDTVDPSPVDHDNVAGVAVAVTDAPGTAAVADRGAHPERSTHNHVGNRTNWISAGFGDDLITGTGNVNALRAHCANTTGAGGAAAAPPPVIAFSAQVPASRHAGGGGAVAPVSCPPCPPCVLPVLDWVPALTWHPAVPD